MKKSNTIIVTANDRLYKEVAQELDIPEELVKKIVHQQALTTRDTIKKGGFENIRYVYLGAIKANHRYNQKMNNEIGREFAIKKIINNDK